MTIYHPVSEFLYELFPSAKGKGTEALVEAIRAFYAQGGYASEVVEVNGMIEVRLGADIPEPNGRNYQKAVGLCEKGRFAEAKPILESLVQLEPTNSEAHRLLGQVCSELGDNEAAIDHLIDALRWAPKNIHALTLMGNIQAKHRKDTDTARRYYEAALAADPADHLAANNIAAQFLNLQKWAEAGAWFTKALAIKPDYANALHGMAIVSERTGKLEAAFGHATEALRHNPKRDELHRQSLALAHHAAGELVDRKEGAAIVAQLCEELHRASGKPVRSVEDESNATAASLEVAETHGRAEHIVRYRPGYPCVEHLEMHELYHLRYITEARGAGHNQLFTATPENQAAFRQAHAKDRARLLKSGIQEANADRYLLGLFHGMNRQVYNAPIDLFIEQQLYTAYPALRPYQFLSLMQLLSEAIQAVTEPRVVALTPPPLLSKSRAYNLLLARQFAELFGVDRTAEFNAAPAEKAKAQTFWNEFVEYRADRQPGEEYELVQHWADDLGLSLYFSLVDEETFRASTSDTLAEQVTQIETDPLDEFSHDPQKVQQMRTFQATAAAQGHTMAVVMFMVDALQHFKGMPLPKIKEIALEIAMLGTQGIHPEKQGYHLHHVPGKTFSGHHLLAYYYVSWKLAIPEMVEQLHLPYEKEYGMAVQLITAT